MNKPKVLVIVEDKKRGSLLFRRLLKLFKIRYRIYEFETNIYTLFLKLKKYDFNVDIKTVLKEYHPESSKLLSNDFAYTYLLFDCDAHHTQKNETRTLEQIVQDNFLTLDEMVKYFNNETDPTIGKIYIDFPMLESYRYTNDYFEDNYKEAKVVISEFGSFKSATGSTFLANKHINDFTQKELSSIILQNLFKANYMLSNKWEKPSFEEYISCLELEHILDVQNDLQKNKRFIYVLNTTMFLVVDYFGNRDGFFDKKIKIYHKPDGKSI